MRLELRDYKCPSCGLNFEAPGLPEGAYGDFLLRSKRGELAYLDAIGDPTYREVGELLTKLPEISSLPAMERANIQRRIYGRVACDPDGDGTPFEIGAPPPCPGCRSHAGNSWRFKNPPVFVDIEVPPVTHLGWQGLSEAEKTSRVKAALHETRPPGA